MGSTKFSKWIVKTKASKLLLIEIALLSLIGFTNTVINHEEIAARMSEIIAVSRVWIYLISTVTVIFSSAVLQCSTVLGISLVAYFVSAAMGKGASIKCFGGIAVRATFFTFLITLADLIGFLTVKRKFISFGILGALSYLPFYLSVFLLISSLAGTKLVLNRKQRITLATICSVSAIFITYPF